MNPFAYMAQTLAPPAQPETPAQDLAQEATGKADAMRQAMRQGPKYAAQLAAAAGVQSAMVMPILKHDLATGRVVRGRDREGRRIYALDPAFDGLQADGMAAAAALLRRHGYEVRPR